MFAEYISITGRVQETAMGIKLNLDHHMSEAGMF